MCRQNEGENTLRHPKSSTSAFEEGRVFLLEAEVLAHPELRDSRSKKMSVETGHSPKGYSATKTLFIGAHVSIAGGLYSNPSNLIAGMQSRATYVTLTN